jgi:hypothetical protein
MDINHYSGTQSRRGLNQETQFFTGINDGNTSARVAEAVSTDSYDFGKAELFVDSANPNIAQRVLFQQINKSDVAQGFPALSAKFGASVMANLLVQAAQDASQQDRAYTIVKNLFANNGKIVVYDRRFNDQLGSN